MKNHRNGNVTYSHQLLGATLVHPDLKEVIPLAPEPIIQQDGQTKNDCERNATRRWLKRFRQEHPHLPVIVVEDALSANAPHLRDLREAGVHYIIGVKPGDHGFLFQHLRILDEAGQMQVLTLHDPATGILHHFRFCNGAPLNESNPDVLVNVLEYWEIHPDGKIQHFSWITDFVLTSDIVWDIMRGGRARWKIENETFNTLKNQGYHLEHNYGHGEQNLSVVLALLMMLAFLVDQVQQACCPLFQAAWDKMKTKCHLWEEIRNRLPCVSLRLHDGVADRLDTWHRAAETGVCEYVVVRRRCPRTMMSVDLRCWTSIAFAVRDELPKPADERRNRAGSGSGKPRLDLLLPRGRRPVKPPLSNWVNQDESHSSDRELLILRRNRPSCDILKEEDWSARSALVRSLAIGRSVRGKSKRGRV